MSPTSNYNRSLLTAKVQRAAATPCWPISARCRSEQNCGNCDNCLQPAEMEDRTIDAQKFLSCVARTGERFGMRHIIDVLRGANTQKIRDWGHDKLSTYGIGSEQSADDWLHLGRSLLQQGLLTETPDRYPVLRLNPLSKEVLRRQRSVEVPARAKPAPDTTRQG